MKTKMWIGAFLLIIFVSMFYAQFKTKSGINSTDDNFKKAHKVFKHDKSMRCDWIRIPDTNIDYKICKAKDNSYYLRRNADGNPDKSGAIFYDCNTSFNDDNAVIYGHNMQNNKMFSELEFYRKESFAKSHNFIYILKKKNAANSEEKYMVKAWMVINDRISKQKLDELKGCLANKEKRQGIAHQIKRYGKINKSKSIMLVTCASRRVLEDKRILVYAERVKRI